MFISVFTGFAAGAPHVLAGVDHIVSIAPSSLRRPKVALRNGLSWGIGHSTGVLVLSAMAILIKDLAHIKRFSSLAEFSVGIGLLVIGVIAIRTAVGLDIHTHEHIHEKDEYAHEHVHLHLRGKEKHTPHSHGATSIGFLHGFAGASHLIAVIPALALPTYGAVLYMTAYLLGSILAMETVVIIISLATLKVGKKVLPLVFGCTGFISILTGFFWLQKIYPQIF